MIFFDEILDLGGWCLFTAVCSLLLRYDRLIKWDRPDCAQADYGLLVHSLNEMCIGINTISSGCSAQMCYERVGDYSSSSKA